MFLDIYLLMFLNLLLEGLAKLDHLFLNLKNMSVRIVNLLNEVNQSWSMKRRGHQSRKQRGYTLRGEVNMFGAPYTVKMKKIFMLTFAVVKALWSINSISLA